MKLIGILIAGMVASASGAAPEKVHIRITVTGPNGPVPDVCLATTGRCDPTGIPDPRVYSITNKLGIAEFDFPRCEDPWLLTYAVPRDPDPTGLEARSIQAELQRIDSLGLNYTVRSKLEAGQEVLNLDLSAPGGVTVTIHPQGLVHQMARTGWFSPDGKVASAEQIIDTGTLRLTGVRKNLPGKYYISFIQTAVWSGKKVEMSRHMAIELGNLQEDTDIGNLVVPDPASNAFLDLTQTMHAPISQVEPGPCSQAVTLVSTDGEVIIVYAVPVTDPKVTPEVCRAVLPVPVGDFFLVPDGFLNYGAHKRLLDRIRAGEDLSNSGIPHFTVAAGETATVNYTWMDAWKAIFKLP